MDWQRDAAQRAHERAWRRQAGDDVIWTASDGTRTGLTALVRDVRPKSGLHVGSDGLREERLRTIVLLKRYLADLGVTIDVTGYFEIDGERWDPAEDLPLLERTGALFGNHSVIEVTVRCAAEAENAVETFDPSIG
jgi:hypothetical protein